MNSNNNQMEIVLIVAIINFDNFNIVICKVDISINN